MALVPGKRVRDRLYIHVDAIEMLDHSIQDQITRAEELIGLQRGRDFNVVKLAPANTKISFLLYQAFFDNAFPVLLDSWAIELASGHTSQRSFRGRQNPPILHRKELLLPKSHPRYGEYAQLTRQLEDAGLLASDTARIGTMKLWEDFLNKAGYSVSGHHLVSDGRAHVTGGAPLKIARHRTALSRSALSTPMQALYRAGYFDGSRTIFDYGCGRGDDIRILAEIGVSARGWDPHFAPEPPKGASDIVNLGFVINVIEDPAERATTLVDAYTLTRQVLAVSAMLASRRGENGEALSDGVRTRRNTFQKYYTQAELAEFINLVLGEKPIAVGLGIFFVFRDKIEEQRYLEGKQRNRAGLERLIARSCRVPREERDRQIYEENRAVLDAVWNQWMALGRRPEGIELSCADELQRLFKLPGRAYRFLESVHGSQAVDDAFRSRKDDLRVYFALQHFDRRTAYKSLPRELRRDIRAFFGSYKEAQTEGMRLLLAAANPEDILRACQEAAAAGLGWLDADHSLQLHTSLVEQLAPVLRVYVGCALRFYGDITNVDLVKIHIGSGKLTLMSFDDFEGRPLPRMRERIKVRLRDQDVQLYGYGGEYGLPYLYLKSRYIPRDFPYYQQQVTFDRALESLGVFDFREHGPRPEIFRQKLSNLGLTVEEFELKPNRKLPKLDDLCGRYWKYRDLVECGETQRRTGISNVPKEPETYRALLSLVTHIVDPVMDYFGGIKITYGFCSAALANCIKTDIAPAIDQHASHERNMRGRRICERLGAAIDFVVPDESMLEVARWVAQNTPFDRLYFYGDGRPMHVSIGPENKRQVVIIEARETSSGRRRVPKMITKEEFLVDGPSPLSGPAG